MPMQTQRAPARRDARPSAPRPRTLDAGPAAADLRFGDLFHLTRRPGSATPLAVARVRRFLSYYRPHIPLLFADLACAVVVAMTALALPLCAHHVTERLKALHSVPAVL